VLDRRMQLTHFVSLTSKTPAADENSSCLFPDRGGLKAECTQSHLPAVGVIFGDRL